MNLDRIIDYLTSLKEKSELSRKDVFCAFDDMLASFDNAHGINALQKGDISDYASIVSRVSRNFADITVAASEQMESGLSLATVKSKIAKIEESIRDIDEKLSDSQQTNEKLYARQRQLEEKNREYAAFLNECEELERKIAALEKKESDLPVKQENYKAAMSDYLHRQTAYEAAEIQLAERAKSLEADKKELDAKQLDFAARKAQVQSRLNELNAKDTELASRLRELETEQRALNEKNAELERKLAALEKKESELPVKQKEYSAAMSDYDDRLNTYESEETKLNESVARLETDKKELSARELDFAARRVQLESRLNELNAKDEELTSILRELEAQERVLNEKNAELRKKTEERTRLEGVVTEMQYTDLPAVERTIRQLEEEKLSWEQQIHAKEREIVEKKEFNEKLKTDFYRKTADCTAEQNIADELETQRNELNIKYQKLLNENAGKRSDINIKHNKIKSLDSDIASYEIQCQKAQLELQNKQEQARKARDKFEGKTREYESKAKILSQALSDLMGERTRGYVNLDDFDSYLDERINRLKTEAEDCAKALEMLMENAEEKYDKR